MSDALSTSLASDSTILTIVVPSFNEEKRWNHDFWQGLASLDCISILFVDDGSTDRTLEMLRNTALQMRADVLALENNSGKAEAIRMGFIHAIERGASTVAFLDADGAFSIEDVHRLINVYIRMRSTNSIDFLWSSRVMLAGRAIERSAVRHYIARVVVTLLSFRFRLKIYDTQSGFKIFNVCELFTESLRTPFFTRWFVDLELLLRLRGKRQDFPTVWEEPVDHWRDVAYSKLSGISVFRDLCLLFLRY